MGRQFVSIGALVILILWLFIFPPTMWSSMAAFPAGVSYQLPGGIVFSSSPTLADVDGDGRPEVIVGTTACRSSKTSGACTYDQRTALVVWRGDGTKMWDTDLGSPTNSSPAVGDINRDGRAEIVVSVGGDNNDRNHFAGVKAYTYNGAGGFDFLWSYAVQDYFPSDGWPDGVYSSPTLCDVNGDGLMEIAFSAWDQRIYLLDHNGHSLWNNLPPGASGEGFLNGDSSFSTAACADLNRDGYQEIIIGADISGGGVLPDGTRPQDGGFLYIFDKDGNILVRRHFPEIIFASPAVGDLDGDGDLEIVSGTGWYWWQVHGRTEQPYVYAFDTGQVFNSSLRYSDTAKLPYLPGWPQPTDYPGTSSPALADLDGDGDLEIIIGTGHPDLQNDTLPGAGSVYAWHHTGQLVSGWPIHPKNQYNNDYPIHSSPTVADVDNDGVLEVLFSMIWDVQVYNANGTFQERLATGWSVFASPAIGDTDGDGKIEVWIGSSNYSGDPAYGYLWRFESNTTGIGKMPWPMFHRDEQHTGRYPLPPYLSVAPTALHFLHQYGDPPNEQAALQFRNTGEGSFSWAVSSKPGAVTVNPSSGTAFYTTTVSTAVTVNTTGYTTGTYSLGNIVITGTVNGTPVGGSPSQIPVTLYVGRVYRAYLPLVMRSAQ